jgi:hypothetical protein
LLTWFGELKLIDSSQSQIQRQTSIALMKNSGDVVFMFMGSLHTITERNNSIVLKPHLFVLVDIDAVWFGSSSIFPIQ